MKKYLLFGFATLAFAASCTEFRNEDAIEVDTTDVTPVVSIKETSKEIEETEDSPAFIAYSIEATVSAAESTTYYSYLLATGEAAELDPAALMKGSYSDLANGVVKYDAESPSTVISFNAEPNAAYTIYAVAANVQGQIGSVVTASLVTSNQETPVVADFAYDEEAATMSVLFSEPIKLSATAAVTATAYDADAEWAATSEIAAADISLADESTVVIALPEFYAGSIVTLSWAEGFVFNSATTKCPACNEEVGYEVASKNFDITVGFIDEEEGDVAIDPDSEDGAYLAQDGSTIFFSDEPAIPVFFTDGTNIAAYGEGAATCTIYDGTMTTEYQLASGVDYKLIGSYQLIGAAFPAEVNFGATAEISFEEGAFLDKYGNKSNAVSTGDIYYRSRMLDVADVEGSYWVTGYSVASDGEVIDTIIEVKVTDAEACELSISGLFYGYAEESVAATFSPHSGSIFIADFQYLTAMDVTLSGVLSDIYFANAEGEFDVEFAYSEDFNYSAVNAWGYYVDGMGFMEIYSSSNFTPAGDDAGGATPMAASVKEFSKPVNFVEMPGMMRKIR